MDARRACSGDEPLDPEGHICARTNGNGAMLPGFMMTLVDDEHAVLADGEQSSGGSAWRATPPLCESTLGLRSLHCAYKPIRASGRCDFPTERCRRELSAYLVSTQLGWNLRRTPSSETVRRA